MNKTIAVALTGASGMPYGLRLIECVLLSGARVQVLYSQAAQIVMKQELHLALPSRASDAQQWFCKRFETDASRLQVFGREEWFAPLASGSNPPDAMVVCPCTMGTLASIAAGLSADLIERAADVCIKEGRKLVLVPRVSRMGVVILPPNPGFYHHPETVQDLVDFVVARILDQIGIPQTLMTRWGA
jgi:4-hydroxy-3-polyprenylbenzoate decarboxylase